MADRTFASLMSRISPNAPGCPAPTIIQHVREAAVRVCERTLAWRVELPIMTLLPGVYEYAYSKPAGSEVHAVFGATINDRPMAVLTLEQAIVMYPAWADIYSGEGLETPWSLTPSNTLNNDEYNESTFNSGPDYVMPDSIASAGGEPRSFTQLMPDKFVVLPMPDAEDSYRVRVFAALKPRRNSDGMDSTVFNDLEDAIFHSALQHLLLIPNINWGDRELAAYHAKQFLSQITERRARANLGNARGTLRAQFPSFGV